jgi:MFS family permease
MPIPSLRPRLSPIWRNRDFRRYWAGEAISNLGDGLTQFAVPLVAVVTLQVTPAQMGLMRGLGSVPNVFIGLLAGVWVDRVSRQRLLIGMNLAAAVLVASVPVAFLLDALSLGHLYALSFVFGVLAPSGGLRGTPSCRPSSRPTSSSRPTASSCSPRRRVGSPVPDSAASSSPSSERRSFC